LSDRGVRITREEQFDHVDTSPPGRPSERRTLQQCVANIEARAGIEQNCGELDADA
jgi:hypothetical protein